MVSLPCGPLIILAPFVRAFGVIAHHAAASATDLKRRDRSRIPFGPVAEAGHRPMARRAKTGQSLTTENVWSSQAAKRRSYRPHATASANQARAGGPGLRRLFAPPAQIEARRTIVQVDGSGEWHCNPSRATTTEKPPPSGAFPIFVSRNGLPASVTAHAPSPPPGPSQARGPAVG